MTQEINTSSIHEQAVITPGVIFDIQRFSVHDGPGVRTTIFFKGCPLSCRWCSNPESQSLKPQLLYFEDLCKACAACADVCSHQAAITRGDAFEYHRGNCVGCGTCTTACMYEARILSGRQVTARELCDQVSKDWRFYMQTGGGVTCGGGEPLMQPAFLETLLTKLHDELGYHTCLDTSGYAPWAVLEKMLPHLELVLLDIKHMDSSRHKELTGVDNRVILQNARELAERKFPVLIRFPLIPGENDDEAHIRSLGMFLRSNNLRAVEVLPYHTYGLNKYRALGMEYLLSEQSKPDVPGCKQLLETYGLQVEVRGIDS